MPRLHEGTPVRITILGGSAATVIALAAVACSGGDAPAADPTAADPTASDPTASDPTASDTASALVGRSPSPTAAAPSSGPEPSETASATGDPAAMTVERAQQIVDATTAAYNDAVIEVVTQQRIGGRFVRAMQDIATDPQADIYEAAWIQTAESGYEQVDTEDPTGASDTVIEVVSDEGGCFSVRIQRDFSGLRADGARETQDDVYLAFERAPEGEDATGAGTGWLRGWDARFLEERPEDLCTRENTGPGGSA